MNKQMNTIEHMSVDVLFVHRNQWNIQACYEANGDSHYNQLLHLEAQESAHKYENEIKRRGIPYENVGGHWQPTTTTTTTTTAKG